MVSAIWWCKSNEPNIKSNWTMATFVPVSSRMQMVLALSRVLKPFIFLVPVNDLAPEDRLGMGVMSVVAAPAISLPVRGGKASRFWMEISVFSWANKKLESRISKVYIISLGIFVVFYFTKLHKRCQNVLTQWFFE